MTSVIESARELFERCEAARRRGLKVGLVPTMGALHDGHLSLVRACAERGADLRVLSIFVNPLQFGPREDFSRYPRTLDADLARCREAGVDLVYAPPASAMYPQGFSSQVEVSGLSDRLEGAFRSGHFRGVCTVVLKLWNAVGPCVALFGRKDYQQWRVLARLALDLDLPIEVIGAPIVREPDGLAMSSRNRYLEPEQRSRALAIVGGLRAAHDAFARGERDPQRLAEAAREPVAAAFDSIDYVTAAQPETLEPALAGGGPPVILIAAHLGGTRLIDNLELGADPRP
jgi:pantoate--beta-alanine ligase